jgi:hypothetical protein
MVDANIKRLMDLMQADVDPNDAAKAGVWYEPRSLWCVKNINMQEYLAQVPFPFVGPVLDVPLPRNCFRNGSKYPVMINRFAVSGVGYPFARPDAPAMQGVPFFEDIIPGAAALNGTAMINTLRFTISSPYRRSFSQSMDLTVGYAPRPTGEPSANRSSSGLFGATTLRFDKPLVLPKNSQIEWDVSSLQGLEFVPDINNLGTLVNPTPLPTEDMRAVLSYLEQGGLFAGNARSRDMLIRTNLSGFTPVPGVDGWPWALPPFFAALGGGPQIPFWDPQARFDTQSFREQNATRAGSTHIYGMSAAIDQIDYDDAVTDPAAFPLAQPAPVSTRLGTRVRIKGGPTSDWWWTPGAPMALVMDTSTPAMVYWLDEPITLMPGDTLDVHAGVPTGSLLPVDLENPLGFPGLFQQSAPSYQFGISFNGFTAING